MRTRWPWPLVLATLLLGACGGSPAESVEAAQEAAELGELETMLEHFTERSADLVLGLEHVAVESRGAVVFLEPLTRILPKGFVAGVEEHEGAAVVTVEDERSGLATIPMLREGGAWKIDGLALPGFWRPIGGQG